jgi:hypothetical protein
MGRECDYRMEMRRGNPKKLGIKPPSAPLRPPCVTVHKVVPVYARHLRYRSGYWMYLQIYTFFTMQHEYATKPMNIQTLHNIDST